MRLFGLALLATTALLAIHVALGGGQLAPTPVRDPCLVRPTLESVAGPTERVARSVLDGAACRLGASREELTVALLAGRGGLEPDDERLQVAFLAGVRRAEADGSLTDVQASVLSTALRLGGAEAVLGWVLER